MRYIGAAIFPLLMILRLCGFRFIRTSSRPAEIISKHSLYLDNMAVLPLHHRYIEARFLFEGIDIEILLVLSTSTTFVIMTIACILFSLYFDKV